VSSSGQALVEDGVEMVWGINPSRSLDWIVACLPTPEAPAEMRCVRQSQWVIAVRLAIYELHAATAEAHCLIQSMACSARAAIRSQALKERR
jgi:hypothetical protein